MATDKNPFLFGIEVKGSSFCNRKAEIRELLSEIYNSQNILLFSQRRYGKTSLIKYVFSKCPKNEILTIYIDLYPVMTEEDFVSMFAQAILKSVYGNIKTALDKISGFFKNIHPQISISSDGTITYHFDINSNKIIYTLDDILESVKKFSDKEKRKLVICFDEFQQIALFPTDRIEKTLRSHIQTHANVSYIFMGSKKHLISDIFNNPNRPFYRSAKSFPLQKISEEELVKFVIARFKSTNKIISKELAQRIVEACESHPYYIQYLSHIIWEEALVQKTVSSNIVTESLKILLEREEPVYDSMWSTLTFMQKRCLLSLSDVGDTENVFSNKYIEKHNLNSYAALKRVVDSLTKKDLIERKGNTCSIIDIFFKKWIKHRISEKR
ncbi:ATP-binding protein [bacterium]